MTSLAADVLIPSFKLDFLLVLSLLVLALLDGPRSSIKGPTGGFPGPVSFFWPVRQGTSLSAIPAPLAFFEVRFNDYHNRIASVRLMYTLRFGDVGGLFDARTMSRWIALFLFCSLVCCATADLQSLTGNTVS